MLLNKVEMTHHEDALILLGGLTGRVGNIPGSLYHKSVGLSFTGLKQFEKSPAHYQAYIRTEMEETPEMRIGTLLHMALLEPERFTTDTILNEGSGNSKEVKLAIEEAKAAGKTVFRKQDEIDQVTGMRDAVLAHKQARLLLSQGSAEEAYYWNDPETGILMKCKPDYFRPAQGIVSDLKTTSSSKLESLREVEKHIYNFKYHWQSAIYLEGLSQTLGYKLNLFAHIFVGREPTLYVEGKFTYPVRVVVLDDASLEKASEEFRPLISSFAHCQRTNTWPGFPDEIETVALPSWTW